MLLAVCLASFLLDEQSKNTDGIALLCFILILIVLAIAPVSVIYGICSRHCNFSKPFQFFLCHYKLGSGAYARLLKMYCTLVSQKSSTGDIVLATAPVLRQLLESQIEVRHHPPQDPLHHLISLAPRFPISLHVPLLCFPSSPFCRNRRF